MAPEWCSEIGKAVCADLLKPSWACYLFPFHRGEQGEDPADWNWFCLFLFPPFHWLICIHVFLCETRLNAPSACLSPGSGHINYDSALLTLPVLLEVETRLKKKTCCNDWVNWGNKHSNLQEASEPFYLHYEWEGLHSSLSRWSGAWISAFYTFQFDGTGPNRSQLTETKLWNIMKSRFFFSKL